LTGLPYIMGTMELKSLSIDGNPFRGIRRDILARGTQAILEYLKSRIVKPEKTEEVREIQNKNNNNLPVETKEPEAARKIAPKEPSKEVLDQYLVATTKVLTHSAGSSQIPDTVWLPGAKITNIVISKNVLTEIPKEIANYSATLNELDISRNKITKIPPFIGDLMKLTYLDISNNQLSTLPEEISSLPHLSQLCASVNRFSAIPNELFRLPKLETLLLSGNQISEINVDGLLQIKTLYTLDLSNNNIARIPPQLGNVTWLKSLTLDGNSFRQPRPQIMSQGTQFVLGYLRDRIPT